MKKGSTTARSSIPHGLGTGRLLGRTAGLGLGFVALGFVALGFLVALARRGLALGFLVALFNYLKGPEGGEVQS